LLGERGLRPIAVSEIKGMIGDGALKLVEAGLAAANGDPRQMGALLPRFLEIYQSNPAEFDLLLPRRGRNPRNAASQGVPHGGRYQQTVFATSQILLALSLAEFFPGVIGGDSVPRRKPHPAPLLEAARQLEIDADQSLMVGDNIHDVEAAHAAGMRCIAVNLWLPSSAAVRVQRRLSGRPFRRIAGACHQTDTE